MGHLDGPGVATGIPEIVNNTAVACADYGAGKIPRLTRAARCIMELEVGLCCTVVAPHVTGKDNAVADALPRFSFWVRALDPFPQGDSRQTFRKKVDARRGRIDVDMLASDEGSKA